MPAAKKKKVSTVVEKKLEKVSEQMNMLLVVFAIGMMLLAYVLYSTFAM